MIHINEYHLVECFLLHRNSFFSKVTNENTKRKFVVSEFNSSFGVADVVMGTYKRSFSAKNVRSVVDPSWVGVVNAWSKDEERVVAEIAAAQGVGVATVRKKIHEFVEATLVKRLNSGKYVIHEDYRIIIETSVAVEAKLRDWKKALRQARRYRKFANFSFVLLDEEHCVVALRNIDEFRRYGIGLASLGRSNVSVYYSPERHNPPDGLNVYKLNECAYYYFKKCLSNS